MKTIFFKQIDNSPLVIFRVAFGFLCFMEAAGAMALGWVERTFIEPKFTFPFMGFEWLQPLPDNWMYLWFSLMAIFGLGMMFGFFYRASAWGWAILWAGVYLMQKSSYNNHYYLLMLLSFLMAILPAHRYFSLDVRRKPSLKKLSMPAWCRWIFIAQMAIVYTYAAIAKLYPDWWSGRFAAQSFNGRYESEHLVSIFENPDFQLFVSYGGFFFDLLIVPLLLMKRTRNFALFLSIFFHLFNSFVFQIGIFPYLALALIVFFYNPETIRKRFLPKKPVFSLTQIIIPKYSKFLVFSISFFLIINLLLPLRHHLISDNVFWTEEGHRLSWRMMLSSRGGYAIFTVKNKETGQTQRIRNSDYLSSKQERRVATNPDMIWQFAQILKKEFAEKGQDVAVYARTYKYINGRRSKPLTDETVDLSSVKWKTFGHQDWLTEFHGWEEEK